MASITAIRDPTTGKSLAPDAIQRVLYVAPKVHVYQIPPLKSTKGYQASEWTVQAAIFQARLRVFETEEQPQTSPAPSTSISNADTVTAATNVRVTVVLEDPSSGDLFAAAPYNNTAAVAHCIDSSRFFAVRVVGDGGMKAMLGIGFEERSDAFDFGVALQDAAKIIGLDKSPNAQRNGRAAAAAPGRAGPAGTAIADQSMSAAKKDYSLKEGETIVVNIGSRGRRNLTSSSDDDETARKPSTDFLSSIKPPPAPASQILPSASNAPLLAPPPSAEQVRKEMRGDAQKDSSATTATSQLAQQQAQQPTAKELGFDDGEFGEFQ